jgi:hypothetical protein
LVNWFSSNALLWLPEWNDRTEIVGRKSRQANLPKKILKNQIKLSVSNNSFTAPDNHFMIATIRTKFHFACPTQKGFFMLKNGTPNYPISCPFFFFIFRNRENWNLAISVFLRTSQLSQFKRKKGTEKAFKSSSPYFPELFTTS